MAGKSSKKSSDNFEKMKREMAAKRKKADSQGKGEAILMEQVKYDSTIALENNDTGKIEDEEIQLPPVNKPNLENSSGSFEEVRENSRNDLITDPMNKKNNKESFKEEKKIEMVVFRIGEEEFAITISIIKEIIRIPPMTKVPNSPPYIAGLYALRGELISVVDSRILFGMNSNALNENCRIVIVEISGKSVGLITDKVSEVISIESREIKEPPSSIKEIDGGVINGMLLLNKEKRVIMILDAAKIIKAGKYNGCIDKQGLQENIINGPIANLIEEEQIIVFSIGTEEYTFSLNDVKEIIRFPEITKVPNTKNYIEGVFSLRNQLLPVINLGKLLNISSKQPDEYSRVIVVTAGELTYGVVVDKASQVMRVKKDSFRNSNNVASCRVDYIKGFFSINSRKRLIMLLETKKLISTEAVANITNSVSENFVKESIKCADEGHKDLKRIVIFKIDKSEYAISVNNIKEINRTNEIVPFTGSPVFIDGMVSLRGDIIPVLNLRTLFGIKPLQKQDGSKFMVVEYRNRTIGILIDSASEVLEISKNLVEKVTESIQGNSDAGYIDGVAKLNQGMRIVLLLNLESTLSFF